MQNIIQAEDDVKGMPDQALQQMAQRPDGRYPQFLVVSEIQRRSNMRKRFESQQQPQGTVKDQIVQQGIASLAPPPPQMQQAMGVPQQMPQQMPQGAPMPPQMPPQGMYAGGVVNMYAGQIVPSQNPYETKGGVFDFFKDRRRLSYDKLVKQRDEQGLSNAGMSNLAELEKEFGVAPSPQSFEDRLASYEGQYEADPITSPDPNALSNQLEMVQSRMNQYEDVIGSVVPKVDPEQDLEDMFSDTEFTAAAVTPKVQPQDAAQIAGMNAAKEDASKADPLATAQAQVAAALGNKNQAVSAYQAMIERANTRATQYETEAATRASELQADAKKDMLANALIELGSGIAGGDFAGGLSRAGRTAADLKARVGAEARAEQRSGREMAEAARQRAEGLTLEEMTKAKEEERYEQSIEIAAAKHASALAESERERQFRSTLSDKEINARVAQQTRQFAQDRTMFDEKVAQAEREGALTRDAAGQAKLAKLISDYISSRSIQERLTNENFNDEAGRLEAEKALASQLQSQYSQFFNTDAVNFADRKASP